MDITPDKNEIKTQIKITNTIYYSLMGGLILFFTVILILLQNQRNPERNELDSIFIFVVPVFGLAMMYASRMIYNRFVSMKSKEKSIQEKIAGYRTAKIISWAMIEGACFLSLVVMLLTTNYLYMVVFLFLMGYFILLKPSKESLMRDMNLNSNEID